MSQGVGHAGRNPTLRWGVYDERIVCGQPNNKLDKLVSIQCFRLYFRCHAQNNTRSRKEGKKYFKKSFDSESPICHTLSMKETTPETKPRDGVWTCSNGLKTEFRYIRDHPHTELFVRVETASGEHWAPTKELKWDAK